MPKLLAFITNPSKAGMDTLLQRMNLVHGVAIKAMVTSKILKFGRRSVLPLTTFARSVTGRATMRSPAVKDKKHVLATPPLQL